MTDEGNHSSSKTRGRSTPKNSLEVDKAKIVGECKHLDFVVIEWRCREFQGIRLDNYEAYKGKCKKCGETILLVEP